MPLKDQETLNVKLSHFLPARQQKRKAPEVPEGKRVYAVGDLHGRLDLLERMIAGIARDGEARGAAEIWTVFLGDLVDRGPDSRGVIERLIALRASGARTRFLLGNHDELFLKAAQGEGKALRILCRNGGEETLLSYGIRLADHPDSDWDEMAELLRAHVPPAHLDFLRGCENVIEMGDYLFVHAGIRPGVPIEGQTPEDLRWIRGEFLQSQAAHPKMIVHGHSISAEVERRANRIGVDTGAFATGRLSAIGLEGDSCWTIEATGEPDQRWLEKKGL